MCSDVPPQLFVPAAPGNQLRQGLLSGVCSCLGAGGGRAEIWQRFPHLLQDRQDHPPPVAEDTGGRLIHCCVWRTSTCFLQTMSGGDGGKSNPVPMATVLKSSEVKMMTEAGREDEF